MSDGGKGSKRRPGEGYGDGWDAVFGKKPEPKEQDEKKEDDNDD